MYYTVNFESLSGSVNKNWFRIDTELLKFVLLEKLKLTEESIVKVTIKG